ncbi:MAG: PAS domain-containing sensor histidine kinase [Dehalococcoidia bacterium]|nr:PAS domain-containing sensor histidine kinase [Dehalococcoidia bacterium]
MSGRWRNLHISCIVFVFLVLSLSHYHELLIGVPVVGEARVTLFLGLSRHVIERFIYLLLVAYASWTLGVKVGVATWLVSALLMLSRALVISPNPRDALMETIATLVIAGLSVALIEMHRRSQRQQEELRKITLALRSSREDYEELFTNGSDAIWVHDLAGKIVIANKACEKLTGYHPSEIVGKEVPQFLSPEGLRLAREVKAKLMEGETVEQRYEQHIVGKGKTEAILELATRLIKVDNKPSAFLNIARDVTEERRLRDNLRVQIHKNLTAQEEERKRIARELHDDVAQSILLLSHRLDILISEAGRKLPTAVVSELEHVHGIADEVYQSLQRYARDLRPSILDQMGLVPALNWLVEEFSKELGIEAEVEAGTLPPLASETELVMFRIAQEALNNVRMHAEASEVSIIVESDASSIRMTITDNGKGFSVPKLTGDLVREGKLGVLGMEERARLIGGHLQIKSKQATGTTVIVEVPVQE